MTFKDAGGGMYSASVNDEHFIDIVKGEDPFGDTYYEIQDVYVTVNGAYMDVTPKDGLGYGGRRTFGTLNAAKASAKEHLQKAMTKNGIEIIITTDNQLSAKEVETLVTNLKVIGSKENKINHT